YLKHTDYNVIVIDFGGLAFTVWYYHIAANSYKIGRYTGRFILFLIDCGLDPRLVHLMGHSLGAHVVGFAGKEVKEAGKLVGRITGLDPNNFGYGRSSPEYRLAPDDAEFTDCITTNYGSMGIGIPVCQANYFANGAGAVQPGCFYLDLVEKCDGIPWAGQDNSCHPTNETVMGEYANTKGSFFDCKDKPHDISIMCRSATIERRIETLERPNRNGSTVRRSARKIRRLNFFSGLSRRRAGPRFGPPTVSSAEPARRAASASLRASWRHPASADSSGSRPDWARPNRLIRLSNLAAALTAPWSG
ncbi:unnamed protein product, partial [Nesidiocoris tenuis]